MIRKESVVLALLLALVLWGGAAADNEISHPLVSPFAEGQLLQGPLLGSQVRFPILGALGDPVDFDAALADGADYVKGMQADFTDDNAGNGTQGSGEDPEVPDDPDDAGWDWAVTSPPHDFHHTVNASSHNLYGATVAGLYYAYLETADGTYLTAMDDVANHIKTTRHDYRTASDIIFLLDYSALVLVQEYADSAKAKFDSRVNAFGAEGWAEYIRDVRGASYPNGIIPWDIGPYVQAAVMLAAEYPAGPYDYDAAADSMAEVLYEDSYGGGPGYFRPDVNDGWDSEYGTVEFWWYTLGLTGLINAFDAAGVHPEEIGGLVDRLLASQLSNGAISYCYGANAGDEDWQSTAYAAMCLADLDQVTHQRAINKMGYYLGATQIAEGGWKYASNNHYPEVGGECTAGLSFTTNDLPVVIVDDDFISQAAVDVYNAANATDYVWGYDAFDNIEDGVNAVTASTVTVEGGTYPEGLITIDKDLSIIGDVSDRPVITPTEDTDHGTHRGWFQVEGAGVVVDLKNLVFDGSGQLIENCIRYQSGPTGTVENCDLSNIYWNHYTGLGVVLVDYTAYSGGSPLDVLPEFYVKDCTFSNIQRVHVSIFGVDKAYIQNCTFTGKGDGDSLDYGVEVGGGGSAEIEDGCVFTNCSGTAVSDGSVSGGILVSEYYGSPSIAVIDGCSLHNNAYGVVVGYDASDASTVTVNDCDIYDNDYGIGNSASGAITMTVTANEIHGNVTTGLYNECDNLVCVGNKFYGNGQNAEDDASGPNQFNSSCPGNYWDDFLLNGGYPTQYNVPGLAGSVDGCPLSIGVTLEPADALLECGETVVFHVMVDEFALDLMGADYKLNYDNTKLTFDNAVVGDLLNTGPGDYFFACQPGAGSIHVNSAHLSTGVDGPGEIAEITFTAIASTIPGSTSLTFSDTELRNSVNETLPGTWTGATVVIDCDDPSITVSLDAPPSPWTCYNETNVPTVDITATDDYDLNCIKYKIDTGSWENLICDLLGTSYATTDEPLPGYALLVDGTYTYYFKATDDAGNESALDSVTFTKDTVKPGPVTGFTTTVGHNKITMNWTNPATDVDRIYIYRNDWNIDYPEYAPGGDPGYPTVGSYDDVQDVGVVVTYVDASFTNTTRGIYAYRGVVYDCAGNYADPTAPYESDHDRSTSYYLGDLASMSASWLPNYDGSVDAFDFSPFSGCYWQTSPAPSCNEADFGPTIEPVRGRFGIPVPDDYIGFEDLMIFAMNYGNVAPVPPPLAATPGELVVGVSLFDDGLAEEAADYRVALREISETDATLQLALVVEGNQGFKGLSSEIAYDHEGLSLASVNATEALLSGDSQVLFMGDEIESTVKIDFAVLGGDVVIGGNGPVAVLTFVKNDGGASSVSIKSIDARDAANGNLTVGFEGGGEFKTTAPETFALKGNTPNPFSQATVIHYDVPRTASVMLTIYNIQGQAVRTLVSGVKEPGTHSTEWNGRDNQGRVVAAGIYFCELKSESFATTHKMMISR
ncbi:MAG: FlgD immunoglobulin-like domain containing protein [Candidatus Eisenbacteria bacterium]